MVRGIALLPFTRNTLTRSLPSSSRKSFDSWIAHSQRIGFFSYLYAVRLSRLYVWEERTGELACFIPLRPLPYQLTLCPLRDGRRGIGISLRRTALCHQRTLVTYMELYSTMWGIYHHLAVYNERGSWYLTSPVYILVSKWIERDERGRDWPCFQLFYIHYTPMEKDCQVFMMVLCMLWLR